MRALHLIGPGQVGRRILARLAGLPFRLVAVSDSGGTLFHREGLDPARILAHRQEGRRIGDLPRAESMPTAVAVDLVGADVVVDATSGGGDATAQAVARGRAALHGGAFLVLCAKNALAAAAADWLLGEHRGRVGIHAALGGTGQQLLQELDELRERCEEVALCGNVTSTVIVQAIERGASVAEGIAHAQELGVAEPDPELDCDGSDAAAKLLAVCGAVFGREGQPGPGFAAVQRAPVRGLDAGTVRERAARGATTRLIARAVRPGRSLRVAFEEVPLDSPFAAPPDRVVYGYRLGGQLRFHLGFGVGHDATAAAALADLQQAAAAGR